LSPEAPNRHLDLTPLRCQDPTVEKRKPHHDLAAFKKTFSSPEAVRVTRTALKDAQALGLTVAMMVEVFQSMRSAHFYKSMTSLADSTRWQDVYHVPWDGLLLYIKFTDDLITEFLLLSFKEK
jgi:motility quorum-sensing regulator/GCU-specific mRNA interferase toxin